MLSNYDNSRHDLDTEYRDFILKFMDRVFETRQDFLKLSPENQRCFQEIVETALSVHSFKEALDTIVKSCDCC